MIRRIDELGRLVIPIEMRKKLDISICDSVNIVVKNKKIIITKSDFTKCEYCLTSINKEDNYCRYCGKKIVENKNDDEKQDEVERDNNGNTSND